MHKSLRVPAVIVTLLWLISPKFNLIGVGEFTQGIRLEDILFFLVYPFFFLTSKRSGPLNLIWGRKQGLCLLSFMLISSFLSVVVLNFNLKTFVFTLRWCEYFLMGGLVTSVVSIAPSVFITTSRWYIGLNALGSIFSMAILGVGARFAGLSAGPWEVSSVLIFLFWGCEPSFTRREKAWYGFLVLVVLFGAQARVQMLAFLFVWMINRDLRSLLLTKLGFFVVISMMALNFDYLLEITRLEKADWNSIQSLLTDARDSMDYNLDFYDLDSETEGDHAMLARLIIWGKFLNLWRASGLLGIFLGIGPGSGGVVVDGFYMRLLVEFGILGTVLFFLTLRQSLGLLDNAARYNLLLSLSIISLTNDPFTSQRIFTAICVSTALLQRIKKQGISLSCDTI